MMKRFLKILVCSLLALSVTACSRNSNTAPKEKVFIKESEVNDMYSNPDNYKDKYVTFTGQIFTDPEESNDKLALQVYIDPKNAEKNTIVICDKTDLKSNDYVKVTGYIVGTFEGKNAFGGTVTAPQIIAEAIEKISFADAVAPTKHLIEVNQTKNSHGVSVTLEKVELADNQTRVYFKIKNDSKYKYSFYSFNTKIIQNSKQYEEEDDYDADYEELHGEIPSGVEEDGVIVFKAIENKDFKIISEGYSDNYDYDRDDFTFNITVK